MDNPATYHVGSLYLTRVKNNAFSDNLFENFVGRLGTYIQIMAPKSTLCVSPHFAPSKVESAPDFYNAWRNILTQIHHTRETVSSQQLSVEEVTEAARTAAQELSQVFTGLAAIVPAARENAPN
jgi:hypothetical protein